jgi:L-asparaginase
MPDTMIETAAALRGIPDKTIVLTGSMPPARFRNTDARVTQQSGSSCPA